MMKFLERGMVFFFEYFIGLIESFKFRCYENVGKFIFKNFV